MKQPVGGQMDQHFRRSVANILRHGDTDIFPFPPENFLFFDSTEQVVTQLAELSGDVPKSLAQWPPQNVGALAPVGYTGFRWAMQIDPLWNAAYLSWVLAIAEEIERARIPADREIVFSYRYKWDEDQSTMWDRDYNWRRYVERAIHKAQTSAFVVSCDISEFYLRINHHRIENAIQHLPGSDAVAPKIKSFLSHLSGTYSFGLPIGGPASRLISELVLSQIDTLLVRNDVDFIRYSDDYYIFAETPDAAFKAVVTLTKLLIQNQGLQLQKSKTKIMSASEFIASNPLVHDAEDTDISAPLGEARHALMSINVHYDPYSPSAAEDYEHLRTELQRFPILELIKAELKKSRVDVALSRRLISACRYLEDDVLDDAIKTIVDNPEILYPVYHNVLITVKEVFPRLSEGAQEYIFNRLRSLIEDQSRVMVLDLNVQYAVRVLALKPSDDIRTLFARLYNSDRNEAIKRDIIIAFSRWNEWHWLSDTKLRFRQASDLERRAILCASFGLEDEGQHWRRHVRRELSPFEQLMQDWAGAKQGHDPSWRVPL